MSHSKELSFKSPERITFPKAAIKTAIISFGTRLCPYTGNSNNVRHQEVFYFRHFLLNFYKRTKVNVLTKLLDKDPPTDYFKDIFTTDINDYDEIIIHNAPNENFYTGGVLDYWEATFNSLLNCKHKNIWYYLTDPKLTLSDLGGYIKKRMTSTKSKFDAGKITVKQCDIFSNKILPNIKLIFTGNNYPLLKTLNKKEQFAQWDQIETHEFWAANIMGTFETGPFPREFDITYSGNMRGARCKVLNSYFKNDKELKKLWRGYEPEYDNITYDKYDEYNSYLKSFIKSYSSFVVGDPEHYDNIKTVRFFECMLSDAVAFVHGPFGNNFIQNEELKNYIIVNNINELKEKLNIYKKNEAIFRRIIILQKDEVSRICGKYKLSFKLQKESKIINKPKPLF